MKALRFEAMSAETWERIKRGIAAEGFQIEADFGQAEAEGVRIGWHYDPSSGCLTVECLKKPALYPLSLVLARIEKKFAALTAH